MWPFGLSGYRALRFEAVPPSKVVTALLCWQSEDCRGATIMVRGHTAIRAFKHAGWVLLVDSLEIRYADVSEVHASEVQRFDDWRRAWQQGL